MQVGVSLSSEPQLPHLGGWRGRELLGDRPRWRRLLGEEKFQWLAGLAPPSLFARAMQVLVTAISPGRFPEALDELPLPPFLQPLDLTGKG